jgi:SAM-dependent methyltransferase
MKHFNRDFQKVNEPFGAGRGSFRLLFDFSIMISCLKDDLKNYKILDFGTGTSWIAEWLNRMGYEVVAFDINMDLSRICQRRVACDKRLNPNLIHFQCGDGHEMPFKTSTFAHICCFDSLHHMHDYHKVLSEFYRVLIPGGRAIFVEPGAKHSTSKETIEFIKKCKKDDPTWIERDVVLEEIYQISQKCGFSQMIIRPSLLPDLREYDFHTWQKFREGDQILEAGYLNWLKAFNYDSRIVFYLDKGQTKIKVNLITPV